VHFVDPKNNYAFHKIFGNPKRSEVLPGFLNAVLMPAVPIVSVEVRNPFQESRLLELKDTVVDVRATDANGSEYIVEMQVERQDAWAQRALYYTSKALVGQLDRGHLYDELRPVYFVGVLDFKLDPKREEWPWLSCYRLREEQTREGYPLEFQLNFIELPRFKKHLESITSDVEAWAWFFKHAEELKEAPTQLATRPGLRAAFDEANALGWTTEELDNYERIAHAALERAKREESARAEGEASGKRSTLLALAQRHLAKGRSEAEVAELLDITPEELRQLLA
jgi:predicted transposase/invertase (TIGR01784 family)